MNDRQIKNEAWRLLWNREWFWRIFGGTMLLGICTGAISAVVNGIINATCTFTPPLLREIVLKKGQMPELTPGLVWGLSVTVLISAFLGLIMNGIRDYGRAVLQVRASDDMDGRWLEAAFSGFKMPLGLAWLWLRLCLVFLPWAILATIAGMALLIPAFVLYHFTGLATVEAVALCTICATLAVCVYLAIMSIPFYRYRYVLRIRADHPDWSASMCLRNCRELVHGQKWRIFKHDCSYWQIILVSLAVELAVVRARERHDVAVA